MSESYHWGHILIAGLLLVLGTLHICHAEATTTQQRVVVDYSEERGPVTHGASGFLHGISADHPVMPLVDPLTVRLVRGAPYHPYLTSYFEPKNLKFIEKIGGVLQIGVHHTVLEHNRDLSRGYISAYRGKEYWPGDYGDWDTWEQLVKDVVEEADTRGIPCIWEILNEPDYDVFWPRSVEQYYEAYKRAYMVIKSVQPDAVITGPNAAVFDFGWLTRFLTFAKENQVLPDILVWHELVYDNGRHIAGRATMIRQWMQDNQIPIGRIWIDEYMGMHIHNYPGNCVSYIAGLERARIELAARGCFVESWDPKGMTGLSVKGEKPTSAWWVYKGYSDLAGRLVDFRSSGTIDGIAGYNSDAAESVILVGNYSADGAYDVKLVLKNLNSAPDLLTSTGSVYIEAEYVPNTGERPLEKPSYALVVKATVADGQAEVMLPNMESHSAYIVKVLPQPRIGGFEPDQPYYLVDFVAEVTKRGAIVSLPNIDTGGRYVLSLLETIHPSIQITTPTSETAASGMMYLQAKVELFDQLLEGLVIMVDGTTIAVLEQWPGAFSLDTNLLSDGQHTLEMIGTLKDGSVLKDQVVFTVDNRWIFQEGFVSLSSAAANLFGLRPFKTEEMSQGWEPCSEQSDDFFGDRHRLRCKGGGNYLIWPLPNLGRLDASIQFYIQSNISPQVLKAFVSTDKEHWSHIPCEITTTSHSQSEWLLVDMHGVWQGERACWFRLEVGEDVGIDQLQLGNLVLIGNQ
ncbi:MAG: hypothetical protein PHV61_05385 [Limnochordia bacterium]|nr:hypothetical protein [Limnochordia bacterium]MDD2629587.1 hypothetical protein [Limnochordia bacterium]